MADLGVDGVIGVFGVRYTDGDSGIDNVSHDKFESDLIELDREPFPIWLTLVLIFIELLNA